MISVKIVRINNAKYTATGPKFLTDSFFKAKSQIEKLQNKVDIILAETDTSDCSISQIIDKISAIKGQHIFKSIEKNTDFPKKQ